jgi:hypothetical protein
MKSKNMRRATVVAVLFAALPVAAVDLFWVGGNTNWTDPNANGAGLSNWSLSSGGAPQGNFPNGGGESAVINLGGSVVNLSATVSIDRMDVLHPTATFSLRATPGLNNTLTMAVSSQNAGTVNLIADGGGSGVAQMTMAGGSTFSNTGTFNFAAPTAGGSVARGFAGSFVNSGAVNVAVNADFNSGAPATNNGTFTVASGGQVFSSAAGVFNQNGGTLANNGAFLFTSGDTFNFNGGNITGNAIEIQNSTLNIGVGSAGTGTFRFISANTHNGNVAAAQTLIISGFSGINTAVNAASFSNAGTLNFTVEGGGAGEARLNLTPGSTLTNTGAINFQLPAAGLNNSRVVNGNLTSSGSMTVGAGVVTTFAGGVGTATTNTGSVTVAATGTINFGSSSTFTQAGGTITNNGAFQLDSDTFNFSGGTTTGNAIALNNSVLNLSAGAGGGQFVFTGSSNTLTGNANPGQTLTVFAPSGVNTLVVAPASFSSAGTIDFLASGGGSGFVQLSMGGAGTFTNTGTVNFKTPTVSGNNSRVLTGNFTNNGTVNVEAGTITTFSGTGSTYTNAATFNVAAGGTLNFGTNGVFTLAGGTLNNLGSVQLDGDTFNFTGGSVTGNAVSMNNSTLNLSAGAGSGQFTFTNPTNTLTGNAKAGQTLTVFAPVGVNTTVTVPASLTNGGTMELLASGGGSGFVQLAIGAGQTLTNTGTVNFKTPTSSGNNARFLNGNFTNNGTVNVETGTATSFSGTGATYTNNSAFNVAAGGTLTFGTSGTFVLAGGTVTNLGTFQLDGDTFNFTGGATAGNAIVLNSSALNLSAGAGMGQFAFTNPSNTLSGNIKSGQTITVLAPSGVNTTVTAAASFSSTGIIDLLATGGGSGFVRLVIGNNGVLTNAGTISLKSPTISGSNARSIAGNLTNNGTFVVEANTASELNGTNATTINNGFFTVQPNASLTFGNGSIFTQAAGTLANNGSFSMEGDTFNFIGGQTTGNPILLSNSILMNGPAATGPGNFRLVNSSSLSGNIAPGQTVNVIATPGVNTSVTATTLTNNGILTLSTTGGGSGVSNLTFPGANSLTNNGQINILPIISSDASRLVTAGLVNNGTYFQSGGTAHTLGPITGTGTMTIAVGNTAATRLVQGSLSLSGSSTLTIAPNSLFNSLNSLSITNTAVLNLTNNDLTIDYTGTSIIAVLIGLYSNDRVIANGSFGGLPTYLAISEAADLGLSEFNGQTIDDTTVIAKFTYVGDGNLDGQVDALDYERIDLAIGNSGVFGTAQGDLNYDGNVDALDYEQVDLNIGNGVGTPLAAVTGGVFIPEPVGGAVLLLAGMGAARRRRV